MFPVFELLPSSREVRQDCRSVSSWASLAALCFRLIQVLMVSRALAGTALGIWALSPSKYSVSLPASERCMPPAQSPQTLVVIMCVPALQSCPTLCDSMDCRPPGSLSMGFSRQEYWSGLPCPPPGDLPDPGIEPKSLRSPALAGKLFATSATWEAQ